MSSQGTEQGGKGRRVNLKGQREDIKMYLLSTLSYSWPPCLKWTFWFISLPSHYSLPHHWLSPPYHLFHWGYISPVFICIFCICMTPFTNKFLRAGTFVVVIAALAVIFFSFRYLERLYFPAPIMVGWYWNHVAQIGTWTHVLGLKPGLKPDWDLNPRSFNWDHTRGLRT